MKMSYILTFKNCESYFTDFWDSFTEFHFTDGEIFFVDLGSTDQSAEKIEAVYAKYKKGLGKYRDLVIEIMPRKAGATTSNRLNEAINKSSGETIFIGSTGMAVFYDWFKYMTLKLEPADVAAVGPIANVANPNQSLDVILEKLAVDVSKLTQPSHFSDFFNSYFTNHSREVPFLESFGMIIKREALNSAGLFDEKIGSQIVADMDLFYRIRKNGNKVLLAEDVFAYKAIADDPAEDSNQIAKDLNSFRNKLVSVYGLQDAEADQVLAEMNYSLVTS